MNLGDDNVVRRLKQQLDHARRLGFQVRMEVLDEEQPGWCQIGKSRLLFVNLSQTAAEQLAQVSETLVDFAASAKRAEQTEMAKQTEQAQPTVAIKAA